MSKTPLRDQVRAALRRLDSRTDAARAIKARCKHPTKKKWFVCEVCKQDTPFLQGDHIVPVGVLAPDLSNLTEWAQRLFVAAEKRQGICPDCHPKKTKKDNVKSRAEFDRLNTAKEKLK